MQERVITAEMKWVLNELIWLQTNEFKWAELIIISVCYINLYSY